MRSYEFVIEATPLVTAIAATVGKTAQDPKSSAPATTQPGTGTITSQGTVNGATTTPAPTAPGTQPATKLTPQQIQAALPAGKKFSYPGVTGQVEVLPPKSGEADINLRIPEIGDVEIDPETISKLAGIAPK